VRGCGKLDNTKSFVLYFYLYFYIVKHFYLLGYLKIYEILTTQLSFNNGQIDSAFLSIPSQYFLSVKFWLSSPVLPGASNDYRYIFSHVL
jgi:hypothetical protein